MTFIQYSLCSKFFLLAAFRTEQMQLVNQSGNAGVIDYRTKRTKRIVVLYPNRRDHNNLLCPMATVTYKRVKTRTGDMLEYEFAECSVICTCEGEHVPLLVRMGTRGIALEIVGNPLCW